MQKKKGIFVGLCGLDMVYYGMSALPENNSKTKVSDFSFAVGGPAANAAITYALLGGEACLYTVIGDTEIGQVIKHTLKKHAVKVIDLCRDDNFGGNVSTIYIDETTGDRTIISGQSNHKGKISLNSEFERRIKEDDFVLYDGNLFGIEKEMSAYVKKYGKPLVLDAGSHKEGFEECFLAEPTVISSENYVDASGKDVFELARCYPIKDCAKTRGERGIQYLKGGSIEEINVPSVNAIDTLGAGDIFHGAYCYYRYVENLNFEEALEEAALVASYSVQKKGVVEGVLFAKEKTI